MEQDTAILIADLSGYTALTEAHGPLTAANLVDKFIDLVKDSLTGSSVFHQQVGDEVLVVSPSPDELMDTAISLFEKCRKEHCFLQVHGALHFGSLLHHKGHYFGSPINLTSRIAGKASTGKLWCSGEFLNRLNREVSQNFIPKGIHNFKNVSQGIEVFEMVPMSNPPAFVDPVCRMQIHDYDNCVKHPHIDSLYFCSKECFDIYVGNE